MNVMKVLWMTWECDEFDGECDEYDGEYDEYDGR